LDTALEMYSTTVGIEHLSTSNALQRLAELHLDMDHRDEALSVAQQALQIRKSLLGMNNEATGESYFIIGKISLFEMSLKLPCLVWILHSKSFESAAESMISGLPTPCTTSDA